MIIVKLQGGLGNQMFQYAMGRALSLRIGVPVYYDKSWYKYVPSSDTPRPFELDLFSLPLLFAEESRIPLECRPIRNGLDFLRRKFTRRAPVLKTLFGLPHLNVLNEDSKGINLDVFKISVGQNVYLNGFWASERYFEKDASSIRKDFTFHQEPDEQNKIFLEKMAADCSAGLAPVSVHIRRGDYSQDPKTNAFHGLLPLDYYRSAMSVMEGQGEKVSYYIFSDDLSWCRDNLKFNPQTTFVDINAGKADWMDMRLMSACRHHIIANSSFSWWGAWLNSYKDKIVIAPHQWLAHDRDIVKNIVPENWIKI